MCGIGNILKEAYIEQVTKADYQPFACFHYRKGRLPVVDKVFALVLPEFGRIAIVVYSFPPCHLLARRMALGDWLPRLDRSSMMRFINANIRSISRVVVVPEFRGISAASLLISNSLDRLCVPLIESVAAMGEFNSFFEKAGFVKSTAPVSDRCRNMANILRENGLGGDMLFDADLALRYINTLSDKQKPRIWHEIDRFIGAYGRKRLLSDKRQRVNIVLSRLNGSGTYFYKFCN
ncbi:MAG: hypothetical protein ACIAQZ_05170 [Sedimentisphaeraceae bacterium JB056]